jgi:hypothetical protein
VKHTDKGKRIDNQVENPRMLELKGEVRPQGRCTGVADIGIEYDITQGEDEYKKVFHLNVFNRS